MIEYIIVIGIIVVLVIILIVLLHQSPNNQSPNNQKPKKPTNIITDDDKLVIDAINKVWGSYYAVKDHASYNTFLADYAAAETLISKLKRPSSRPLSKPFTHGLIANVYNFGSIGRGKHVKYANYSRILLQLISIAPKLSDPNVTDTEKNTAAELLVDFMKSYYETSVDNILVQVYNILRDPYKYDKTKVLFPQDVVDLATTKILADLEKSRDNDPPDLYNSYLCQIISRAFALEHLFNFKGLDAKLRSIKLKPV